MPNTLQMSQVTGVAGWLSCTGGGKSTTRETDRSLTHETGHSPRRQVTPQETGQLQDQVNHQGDHVHHGD